MRGCEKTIGHFLGKAQGSLQERRGRQVCNLSSSVQNIDSTQTRSTQYILMKNSAANLEEPPINKQV